MNIALIGPNGAGKSTLLATLLKLQTHIIPFSFSNYAILSSKRRLPKYLRVGKHEVVRERIIDVKLKWGTAFDRSLFGEAENYLLDEVFLTKVLACAPASNSLMVSFRQEFEKLIEEIKHQEQSYVDAYIYVRPSEVRWKANISNRPSKATSGNHNLSKFLTQISCTDYFISTLVATPYTVVQDVDLDGANKVKEFLEATFKK